MNPNYYGQILFPKTAKFAAVSCPPSKSLMQAQGVEGGRAALSARGVRGAARRGRGAAPRAARRHFCIKRCIRAFNKLCFSHAETVILYNNPMPPLQSSHNLDYTKYTALFVILQHCKRYNWKNRDYIQTYASHIPEFTNYSYITTTTNTRGTQDKSSNHVKIKRGIQSHKHSCVTIIVG